MIYNSRCKNIKANSIIKKIFFAKDLYIIKNLTLTDI